MVDGMSSKLDHKPYFGVILITCWKLLIFLPNFRLCFIRRQVNNVVRLLAKVASSHVSHNTFNYITACIITTLMNEMS